MILQKKCKLISGGARMKKTICLPNMHAVKSFVEAASEMDEVVLVSPKGFNHLFDGASILGMVSLMVNQICVDFSNSSDRFINIINNYINE